MYPAEEARAKIGPGHHFLEQVLTNQRHFIVGGENELAALLAQSLDS